MRLAPACLTGGPEHSGALLAGAAQLPSNVLQAIITGSSSRRIAGLHRRLGVCRSWRAAAPQDHELLSLMLPGDDLSQQQLSTAVEWLVRHGCSVSSLLLLWKKSKGSNAQAAVLSALHTAAAAAAAAGPGRPVQQRQLQLVHLALLDLVAVGPLLPYLQQLQHLGARVQHSDIQISNGSTSGGASAAAGAVAAAAVQQHTQLISLYLLLEPSSHASLDIDIQGNWDCLSTLLPPGLRQLALEGSSDDLTTISCSCLADLPCLQRLDLQHVQPLSLELLSSLQDLQQLSTKHIYEAVDCRLLAPCKALQRLDVLTDTLSHVTTLASMQSLQQLQLPEVSVEVQELAPLRHVLVDCTAPDSASGADLAQLTQLTSLQWPQLEQLSLTAEQAQQLTALVKVELCDPRQLLTAFATLQMLPRLNHLVLSHVSAAGIASLAGMTQITQVDFTALGEPAEQQWREQWAAAIAQLTQLKVLTIIDGWLLCTSTPWLSCLWQLSRLEVWFCSPPKQQRLPQLLKPPQQQLLVTLGDLGGHGMPSLRELFEYFLAELPPSITVMQHYTNLPVDALLAPAPHLPEVWEVDADGLEGSKQW